MRCGTSSNNKARGLLDSGSRCPGARCARPGSLGRNDGAGFCMTNKSSAKPQYTCPHCGAVYEVSAARRGKATYRTATCSYCGDVMAEWNGPARHYHRIKRPHTATQLAKIVDEVASDRSRGRKPQRPGRRKGRLLGRPQKQKKPRTVGRR